MKKFLIFFACLAAAAGVYAAGKAVNEDPEIFGKLNRKVARYVGIMPKNVRTIAFISPGSYPGAPHHRKGIELLQQAGYKVKVMPHAFVREKNKNSAPVAGKVADFYAAWNDPEVDMIFCIRGGMGSEDLMDNIDWSKLKKRPELYVQGYSDATIVVCALAAKGYGHPIAGVMSGSLTGVTDDTIAAMKKMNHGKKLGPIKVQTLVGGDCKGKPLGGSLWKLCRLIGKNYCPDTANRIIFIEASRLKPETIRQKIIELRDKKFFAKASGVVFGQFANCKPAAKVQAILRELAPTLGVPVYNNFPFGHVPCCYSLDFCRTVEIKNGEVIFPAVASVE